MCCGGKSPKILKVTIAGVVPKNPVDCPDCPDWNGEHEVKVDPAFPHDGENGLCYWTAYDLPCDGSEGVYPGIIVWLQCTGENMTTIYVEAFEGPAMAQTAAFILTVVGGPVDCENLGAIPLAVAGSISCDWSAATCVLGS